MRWTAPAELAGHGRRAAGAELSRGIHGPPPPAPPCRPARRPLLRPPGRRRNAPWPRREGRGPCRLISASPQTAPMAGALGVGVARPRRGLPACPSPPVHVQGGCTRADMGRAKSCRRASAARGGRPTTAMHGLPARSPEAAPSTADRPLPPVPPPPRRVSTCSRLPLIAREGRRQSRIPPRGGRGVIQCRPSQGWPRPASHGAATRAGMRAWQGGDTAAWRTAQALSRTYP